MNSAQISEKILQQARKEFPTPEMLGTLIGMSIKEAIAPLKERLDQLESELREVADNGFRYRGYWRDGMKFKRGDAVTDDGSMWWALRSTSDRPKQESADWQIAVRKGRDGK